MFAGNYNPEDWALCNGASLTIAQNNALYSLIGIIYGGNGTTNFQLPDLRCRIPIGQGTNTTTTPPLTARVIAQTGGEESHTVTEAEMPAHTHPVYAVSANATSQIPGPTMGYGMVQPNTQANIYGLYSSPGPPVPTAAPLDVRAVTSEGGNVPHPNMMLTTAISFIIALLGNYPTRP